MTIRGFEAAQAVFVAPDSARLIGQVRRFGAKGPAYEVVDRRHNGDVVITVVQSGETLDYPLAALLADPIAETIP